MKVTHSSSSSQQQQFLAAVRPCYLAAVRHFQVINNMTPVPLSSTHELQLVIAGARRCLPRLVDSSRQRMPITTSVLREIKALWLAKAHEFDVMLLWAVCCTSFFGFFRMGELTVPSPASYDPNLHLSFSDVSVDSRQASSMACIHSRRSKTHQFGRGADIYPGRTDGDLCPLVALMSYVVAQSDALSLLFCWADGSLLTPGAFIAKLREAFRLLGYDPTLYAGHSFRIGAATAAAVAGILNSTI